MAIKKKSTKKSSSTKTSDSAKTSKSKSAKKKSNLSLYSNLVYKRKTKKDAETRKHAEYLASLPKNPVKRFFYRLHPKRFFGYWFSKRGLKTFLKIVGVIVLIGVLGVAALFAYFQKDLDSIRPEELAKNVQSTVNSYYDRNGTLLWEDKGDGNYKLVVDGSEISTYMRQATVAIEDKDFYNHKGVSITGLVRSAINNVFGGSTQGGSTLTQQLIKQVYFSDEAGERGLAGVPRKIKEMILAVEVERMYDKEQIITLYLNESPYGGRRNGVESGAQTYFGKSAKDLNLAESALLAGIPNNPAVLNPYNTAGNEDLIKRQHKVLDSMVDMGFVTAEEAKAAKEIAILDTIKSEVSQYANIKAPHFLLEVRKQLEAEFGVKTVRAGGLKIITSLDYDAQKYAEQAVENHKGDLALSGSDNVALSSVDVATGQVVAMIGSIDYNVEGYGQTNASTSPLEPGSSIKPIVDYAPLFKQRQGVNYGPGSVLRDENIDSIYCAGYQGSCSVKNFTGRFYGNVTIRSALSSSLNIPAIKAMYISGVDESIQTAQDLGDLTYCSDNNGAGLSAAIGGGCSVKPVEHANAYASLARGGVYKELSYILEVKNSSNEVIKKWEDSEGKSAVDPQVAYMISDILHDPNARNSLGIWGAASYSYGFVVPGVWTATKTGTTENGAGKPKDYWVQSYSPVVSTSVWHGNHDGSALSGNDSMHVAGRRIIGEYMENVHMKVYGPQGRWNGEMTIEKPSGIQTLTVNGRSDIWPSWFNKTVTGAEKVTMTFDSVSKKKATNCTPSSTKIDIEVLKVEDPVTKKITYSAEGYDPNADDDIHKCSDTKPSVSLSVSPSGAITITATGGTHSLSSYSLSVDGSAISSGPISGTVIVNHTFTSPGQSVSVTVKDSAGYTASDTTTNP